MKALTEKLAEIQRTLNAPKSQHNTFGGYNYRSCEDILQAVKPLLGGLVITVNDEMQAVGERVYVKATATLTDGEHSISTTAFAREAAAKKGMDDSQITGSTSSYARKYALNANDADTINKYVQAAQQRGASQLQMQSIQDAAYERLEALRGAPA